MTNSLPLRIKQKIWKMVLGESSWVNHNGSLRMRESFGLISRPNYAYGMLRAADTAAYFGHTRVTVVEFGVASGHGLLNLIYLGDLISAETKIGFDIVGFDTGAGLPQVVGPKDHPEIWNPGDFAMEERDTLVKRIDGRARIVWGDIAQTITGFTNSMKPCAPLGFVSVDVDIYSGTVPALKVLGGPSVNYLPAVSMYFDDVSFFFANRWCGELAAIEEFNAMNDHRKIDQDRSLPGSRPYQLVSWYNQMLACHILDHPARQAPIDRPSLSIGTHHQFMSRRHLL